LIGDSASLLEILVVCAENKFVDVDLTAIAELNCQIRMVRIVIPTACIIISIVLWGHDNRSGAYPEFSMMMFATV
jgi:hypothetical protein